MESSCMEIGRLAFPPYVLQYALQFLDGRALTIFETASRGTRQAVEDSPGLYKALLLRQVDNIPHMSSLPNKEGKRALMSWDAGDFQPVLALVSSRRSPPPRYLHRVAEAGDGWTYLHGGHLESGLSGDVWRFRVSESSRSSDDSTVRGVKVRWEQVWGGEHGQESGADDAGTDVTDGSSSGGESDKAQEPENKAAVDGDGGANAAAAAPDAAPHDPHHPASPSPAPAQALEPAPGEAAALGAIPAPPPPNQAVAAAAAAVGPAAGAQPAPQPAFQAAMLAVNHGILGVGFEDAAGVDANGPRPRCAASWTPIPGTNRIILFGGQGSDNQFLDDLWCFHAGRRGECRWELLDQEREPRPTGAAGGGGGGGAEGQGEEGANDNEGGGAGGPWRVPEGRWGHTMVEHRGLLYMFGGSSPGTAYAGLWRLDTSVSPCMWSLMKPAGDMAETGTIRSDRPGARGGHSATVVKDSLYIFGGNILQSVFKDLWAVDLPACTAWRQVPRTPEFPPARIGHIAVAVGNRILVFGGRNFKTGVFTGGLYCFDVELQAFVRFPHAEAFSRESVHPGGMWNGLRMTGHAAVPCSRGLLIVGGLLPLGQSFTMRAWALDVVGGTRAARKQRRRLRSRFVEMTAGGCGPS